MAGSKSRSAKRNKATTKKSHAKGKQVDQEPIDQDLGGLIEDERAPSVVEDQGGDMSNLPPTALDSLGEEPPLVAETSPQMYSSPENNKEGETGSKTSASSDRTPDIAADSANDDEEEGDPSPIDSQGAHDAAVTPLVTTLVSSDHVATDVAAVQVDSAAVHEEHDVGPTRPLEPSHNKSAELMTTTLSKDNSASSPLVIQADNPSHQVSTQYDDTLPPVAAVRSENESNEGRDELAQEPTTDQQDKPTIAPAEEKEADDPMLTDPVHDDNKDNEEVEEAWDLIKVLSRAQVTTDCPIKCSTETCSLAAACVYVSNKAPTDKWYSCLDCQEADFGGWPEDSKEIPLTFMTHDHRKALMAKCSRQSDLTMPPLPLEDPNGTDPLETLLASPPPKGPSDSPLMMMINACTPAPSLGIHTDGPAMAAAVITPSPVLVCMARMDSGATHPKSQPSQQALAMHRKWQEAAEAMGGPDARIIVSKPVAKKLIYQLLHDTFAPMNITQIHKELKAVVPSPVLKACLDDMALDQQPDFDASDDEDSKPSSHHKDRKAGTGKSTASSTSADDTFAGSLRLKAGKSPNACLYYVDYTKAKDGLGLDVVQRNEIASKLAQAQAEQRALEQAMEAMKKETTRLLAEPTNEELVQRLYEGERALQELQAKAEASREFLRHAKYGQQLKKRIDCMAIHWRKRRRLCIDFLANLEVNSDGAVSMQKCLKGDGPLELDSDEAVVAAALAYAKKKKEEHALRAKQRSTAVSKKATLHGSTASRGLPLPSESFVAVTLDSRGFVQRVHLADD